MQVANSVLSPNFVGLYQIGIVIPSGLAQGTQPLIVTAAGIPAPPVQVFSAPATTTGACADISGTWKAQETFTIKWVDTAMGMTESTTETGSGSGTVTIVHDGCSIRFSPIGISRLIPGVLTTQQAVMLDRQGTVTGNTFTIHGILALIDFVAAGVQGVTVSENSLQRTGQLSGSTIQLQATGRLALSGPVPGLGFATETADVVSSTTFQRP